MKSRQKDLLAAAILLFLFSLFCFIAGFAYREFERFRGSLPAWELTAFNTSEGIVLEIYKENEKSPTFATLLKGHSIPQSVERATRDELPTEVGRSLDYDDTIRPGSWTLEVDKVRIAVHPNALRIDREAEIAPLK